jgi:hypothetical protein
MIYIVDGELVDTYGGDFTYRDVWYEIDNGEYIFYEKYYGAKPSNIERVINEKEIAEYMREINL